MNAAVRTGYRIATFKLAANDRPFACIAIAGRVLGRPPGMQHRMSHAVSRMNMPDEAEFKEALSRFPTGVTVLTLRKSEGAPLGLTVSAFTSVSLEPQLVLACVEATSRCVSALRDGGFFAFSILSEDQGDVAEHFAAPLANKFSRFSHSDGANGAPLIDDACAHIECSLAGCHDGGDHVIVVGAVEKIVLSHNRPLIYAMGDFHRFARTRLASIDRDVPPARAMGAEFFVEKDTTVLKSLWREGR